MTFGVCLGVEQLLRRCPAEADYIELPGAALRTLSPDAARQLRAGIDEGIVKTYSCNSLIGADMRLTGPDVDFAAIRSYCDELFYRLSEYGITLPVFGSGKAKHVPDGFPMERAWEQLFTLGDIMADAAEQYGQTVAVEPLSYREVNIVNTVEDGAYYVRSVNRDNFKLLVDFYHFNNNGEDFSSINRHKQLLVHTHFAAPITRALPKSEQDWALVTEWLTQLKRIGYTGGISFEGSGADSEQLDAMLHNMKQIEKSIVC